MEKKNKIAVIVGYNIKRYIYSRGITPQQLAIDSGIEYSQLRKYLSGYLMMGIDKIPLICEALQCYPDYLFLGTDSKFIDIIYNEAINYSNKED